jgi:hypothetical protein
LAVLIAILWFEQLGHRLKWASAGFGLGLAAPTPHWAVLLIILFGHARLAYEESGAMTA